MQSKHVVKLLILLLLLSETLFAIDGNVRVFIKSDATVYTSQKVTVSVELLSDAFSITGANIVFPDSPKYIVQAPKSAAYLGTEEINGTDWTMVHYDYDVYALRAGKIEIPSLSVSFTASMGYGQPKKEFALKSDALSFDVKAPKGVKQNQFVLVTDNYTLVSEMKPENKQLIIGDAVELSVTQMAHDVPDVLLKPMDYTSNTFLRVYTKEPELKSGLKGKYDVSRIDRFTFVASGEGNVTLPAQEILWWNSMTEKVEVETIPKISFEILPDPQIAIDAKKAQEKQRLLYIIVIVFLFLILYKIFGTKVRAYLRERKRVYRLSEAGKFSALLASLEEDDAPAVYKQLYIWLLSIDPKLSNGGFASIIKVQLSFETSLHALEQAMLDSSQRLDTIVFKEELGKLRERLLKKEQRTSAGLPETINPN